MHLEASVVFITAIIYVSSIIKGLEAISSVGLPPNWALATINRSSFPNDFTFGSASSSFQNEGGANEDGRAPSIWDIFARRHPDRIADHSNAVMATDSYHRYKEDVKMLRQMSMDAYSFSISWSRVIPHIEPFVTLFHWDLPQALEEEYGGFLSSRVVNDFRDFAELCFRRFGDRVKYWITLNEPWSYSVGGYEKGYYAPGRCSHFAGNCSAGDSGIEPYIVAHNLLLSHASAVKLYHDIYKGPQKGKIGISLVTRWMVPFSDEKLHRDAALRAMDFEFDSVDAPKGVDETSNSSLSLRTVLQDDFRVQYYVGHLQKLLQAINSGVNVKGYFAWSLLDNFQWERGYAVRFGLHFVDYGNELRRYPKFSSTWFTNFLRIRG
ncbi:putative beta-primeverosidase [Helianthus anomalus]